ncbi:hypothetical protein ANANG_G00219040 [Anguilla anguilla]|uniref:Uncharacterized protein n=1 Tax=Anguilla anguilla TaxID=7936 RepID=A0A9D3LVY9_ANGAN|nr:hypothetical protein ANANG_G00219040 [Anguilla anguilla]
MAVVFLLRVPRDPVLSRFPAAPEQRREEPQPRLGEVLGRNPHGLPNHHFPVNHQPRSQGRPEYWGQEVERELENGRVQRRRESHVTRAPIWRDGGRSQSEWANPGVGVELWGDRHYHSLPQKWRLEAKLQRSQESRGIPQWVERRGNTSQQGAPCPREYHHLRGIRHLEEKQPAISYGVSQTQKRPCREERNSHRVIFGQPPSYVSPPPYSAPHRTLVGMQQPQK